MRKIKYQAWLGHAMIQVTKLDLIKNTSGEYGNHGEGYFLSGENRGTHTGFRMSDAKFREFTGLKDKNGKEVYESDILKFDICMCKGMLEEKTITFHSEVEFKDGYYYAEDWLLCELDEYEVIGNKFENPSLLEVQHD